MAVARRRDRISGNDRAHKWLTKKIGRYDYDNQLDLSTSFSPVIPKFASLDYLSTDFDLTSLTSRQSSIEPQERERRANIFSSCANNSAEMQGFVALAKGKP